MEQQNFVLSMHQMYQKLIFKVISNEIYSKSIEVIGPEVITFKEILEKLLIAINKKRVLLPLPLFLQKQVLQFFNFYQHH